MLLEKQQIKLIADPVDMDTAAITGARLNMGKAAKVAIVLAMGDSVGATVQFTLKQHTAASGGSSKNLSVANPYYKKVAAATAFTKVEPTVAAALYDVSSDFAAQQGVLVLEVLADQLDTDGGYSYISVDVADSGAAKILCGLMIAYECRLAPAYAEVL
jgi:hypothetical protein